jgi:hypothetical protein
MKNKAYQFTEMSEEERSMHLFYTIEGMIESLQEISNEMDPESPTGCSRLALISDMEEKIEALYNRVHKDFISNKTKNAIAYSI